MTYNLGMGRIDGARLVAMIEREHVDLICFQEGYPFDPTLDAYLSRHWYRDRSLGLASRFPVVHDDGPFRASRSRNSATRRGCAASGSVPLRGPNSCSPRSTCRRCARA